jgi:hypothetical protein
LRRVARYRRFTALPHWLISWLSEHRALIHYAIS